MSIPIPTAALDDRLGITGTAGSGKTYAGMWAVERLLTKKARVIVSDPLDVWWGLRLTKDGEDESGFKVVIFGGQRADIPINEHAGALVGEAVASTSESCIVSLEDIPTGAGKRRFMLAFLTALYRHHKDDPVHLIFDEADMWAPQQIRDREGEAQKLLGMMETIVRRGRVRGFIPWLITQRPAVIHKDVLSQMDGLITFKLTSSQDRNAIGAWVEGQADVGQWKAVYGELATYQKGEALVWIPGRGQFGRESFPEKETYDSSRAPKRGERHRVISLPPLDVNKLKEKLASVAEEAKANDPRELRATIAKLRQELAAKPKQQKGWDKEDLAAAFTRGREAADKRHMQEMEKLQKVFASLQQRVAAADTTIAELISGYQVSLSLNKELLTPKPEHRVVTGLREAVRHARGEDVGAIVHHRRTTPRPTGDGEKLPKADRKILTALAQYPEGRTRQQVAVLTGYSHKGGGFNNALTRLRGQEFIVGRDSLQITQAGIEALGDFDPLPTGHELYEYWKGQLPKAASLALEALVKVYPKAMSKADVAEMAGYEADGGGFNNALSRLRSLELIDRNAGEIRASDNLFGE